MVLIVFSDFVVKLAFLAVIFKAYTEAFGP